MRRTLYIVALATALALGEHVQAARASQANLEYEVKAAFLYNFAKFVEWPDNAFASANAPVVFCIVGANPFDGALERVISDRTAHGRKIVVREVAEPTSSCHLVFIAASEDDRVARLVQIAQTVQGAPVLTVGESTAFADSKGMIRLLVEEGGVRFDIDAAAAERAGLKFSSQLLKLARQVLR